MKEPPKHQDFKITIDGKPAFFASNITIAQAIDEDTTKDLDGFCVRDHTSIDESDPWATSFSFETTMEPSPEFRRFINRMLGRIRPNRGSSRTENQRYFRAAHYWVKIGRMAFFLQPKQTLADYRKFNPNKPPF